LAVDLSILLGCSCGELERSEEERKEKRAAMLSASYNTDYNYLYEIIR